MATFEFEKMHPACEDPIRGDLAEAYRAAWAHIAAPGTWLTGSARVAIAEQTRLARTCPLCAERKAALSSFSVNGEHEGQDRTSSLRAPLVELAHRITTDASRLRKAWHESLIADGISAEEYVEALAVTVITISIDRFHQAMGLPLEPLPTPQPGEPSRIRMEGAVQDEAWVPILSPRQAAEEAGLGRMPAPNVIRALSLVPAEVRAWRAVSAAQYLGEQDMMRFTSPRTASRSQIELVAGRVSALNECFY